MNDRTKTWANLGALMVAVVAALFAVEGGYVNDPNDKGGETNHGITVGAAREHGYTGPMSSLPKGMAQGIYIDTYIKAPKYDLILQQSPAVGTKVVDAGVNAGPGRASRWLQQSINDLSRGGRDYALVAVDGAVGPRTLASYRALEQRRGRVKACEMTLKMLDAYQAAHYTSLARSHSNASFMVGWVDNRLGNVPASRCAETVGSGL